MQVILKQNVNRLGHRGQIVDIATGYARNYLLPRGIAVKASPGALKQLELVRDKIELEEAQTRKEYTTVAEKLAAAVPILEASANEEGHLYGSIGPKEIAQKLQEMGFETKANQIALERHLKEVGEFKVVVDLYHQVECTVIGYVVGPNGMGMPEPETPEEGEQEDEGQAAPEDAAEATPVENPVEE